MELVTLLKRASSSLSLVQGQPNVRHVRDHGTSTAACTIYSPCYKLKSNKAFIKAALGVSSSLHGARILGDRFV